MIRLVLVDDQPVVRRSLRRRLLLEPDITVVGEAGNGREALTVVQHLAPDVVVMDIAMPEMDGISAVAEMRASSPQSAVVMLSISDEVSMRDRAHAAGAVAFVHKSGAIEELLATIRQAAKIAHGNAWAPQAAAPRAAPEKEGSCMCFRADPNP